MLPTLLPTLSRMPDPHPWYRLAADPMDLPPDNPIRLLYEESVRNSPPIPELPPFRGDVPVYASPDRTTWHQRHPDRAAPFPLEDVPDKFTSRAQAALRIDESAITTEKVLASRTRLDAICDDVKFRDTARSAVKEEDEVFFDPADNRFWLYPGT